jgi:hypothetical protein
MVHLWRIYIYNTYWNGDFRYVKLPESTFLAKETTGELISNLIANEVHLCSNQEHDLASRGFPDPFPVPSFPILHKKARYVGAASLLVGGQYRSICSPSSAPTGLLFMPYLGRTSFHMSNVWKRVYLRSWAPIKEKMRSWDDPPENMEVGIYI